jgi:hypothetical protein
LKSILQCLVFALAVGSASAQVTIVQFTTGTEPGSGPFYIGESFTTAGGGPWNNISFTFYGTPAVGSTPASNPIGAGTAFLLTEQYLGTPAALSSSTPGFLAQSVSNAGGVYTFPAGITLNSNTQYWVYENALIVISGNGTAGIPSQFLYFSATSTANFVTGGGTEVTNFRVAGDPAGVSTTPIPPSILLTGLGVGTAALIQARRRFQARLGA